MFSVLVSLLISLGTTCCSFPCDEVTHSECGNDDANLLLEINAANEEGCHFFCLGYGEVCKFFIFDNTPLVRGNCRIYDNNFSEYILEDCNELAGPKTSVNDCDFVNPPDNSCQIFRSGKCDFGVVEESHSMSSWENCQASCQSISECQLWRFLREEGRCLILYSTERNCKWQFFPRVPSSNSCDNDSPTTTTTTKPSQCPGEGWANFGDSCYKILNNQNNQYNDIHICREECASLGGTLGSVHSLEENKFIWSLLRPATGRVNSETFIWEDGSLLRPGTGNHEQNTFLGAERVNSDTFRWEDGTPWDYSIWYPGQPDGQDCLTIGYYSFDPDKWVDGICSWGGHNNWDCLCKKPSTV